jgi:hypothetical protein
LIERQKDLAGILNLKLGWLAETDDGHRWIRKPLNE